MCLSANQLLRFTHSLRSLHESYHLFRGSLVDLRFWATRDCGEERGLGGQAEDCEAAGESVPGHLRDCEVVGLGGQAEDREAAGECVPGLIAPLSSDVLHHLTHMAKNLRSRRAM